MAELRRGREGWAADEWILGSGAFVEQILREVTPATPPWPRPRAQAALLMLMEVCTATWGATPDKLQQGSRRRVVVLGRAVVSALAVARMRLPAAVVAGALGVTLAVVWRGVNRGPELLATRGMAADDVLVMVEEHVS